MKKNLMSLGVMVALALTVTSCLKNNVPNSKPVQDPALEKSVIDTYIASKGFTMAEQTDSSRIVITDGYGLYFQMIATPGLMYEIIAPGDVTNDSVKVLNSTIGVLPATDSSWVFNTVSDSTQVVAVQYKGTLLDGTVFDSTAAAETRSFPLYRLVTSWKALLGKVGKGGHIRLVTPSAYAYGPYARKAIPANSPLFFDVYLKGTLNNAKASKLKQ